MDADYWLKQLEYEGYTDLAVHEFPANTEMPEHTHDVSTVHLILSGEFTLIDPVGERTYSRGERIDMPPGTTHRARVGLAGSTLVVGVKK